MLLQPTRVFFPGFYTYLSIFTCLIIYSLNQFLVKLRPSNYLVFVRFLKFSRIEPECSRFFCPSKKLRQQGFTFSATRCCIV